MKTEYHYHFRWVHNFLVIAIWENVCEGVIEDQYESSCMLVQEMHNNSTLHSRLVMQHFQINSSSLKKMLPFDFIRDLEFVSDFVKHEDLQGFSLLSFL
jgi:hypothetical protein